MENHQILGSNFESPTATSPFGRLAHRVPFRWPCLHHHSPHRWSPKLLHLRQRRKWSSRIHWRRFLFSFSSCFFLAQYLIRRASWWFFFVQAVASTLFSSWILDPHETATDIASIENKKAAAVGAFSLTFGVCCLLVGRPRWMHCTKVSSRKKSCLCDVRSCFCTRACMILW